MAKETAEQKLLKMLKKPEAAASVAQPTTKKKISFSIGMQTINQLLFLGIVVCIVALVLQIRAGSMLLGQRVDLIDDQKASTIADIALPSAKNISSYLDQINARNIFKPYDAQVKENAVVDNSLAHQLSKYKLVGVAWLDLPETASIMIEDTTNKQTYFLKQGEQIEGVTVKTIYTDRAIFGDENEETTIKL